MISDKRHSDENLYMVDDENACMRLDLFVAECLTGISRSSVQKLISDGSVLVNGGCKEKKYTVSKGDRIVIKNPEKKTIEVLPMEIKLDIVFEDDVLIIVNKPKGMVVHPGAGGEQDTLVNALLFRYGRENLSDINGDLSRPGIVHRLDKQTSGLLVVAKTNDAHDFISQQIKDRKVYKEYAAVIHGKFPEPEIVIDLPISRHKINRKKMAVCDGGRDAITYVKMVQEFGKYSHIKVVLETGRTHQIRVHLAYMNRPVAGDTVYGGKKLSKREILLDGQCLHSKKLGFIHPVTRKFVEFDSDLPDYFSEFLDYCEKIQ